MKNLNCVLIQNSDGKEVELKPKEYVELINENDLEKFGIDSERQLTPEMIKKLMEKNDFSLSLEKINSKFVYEVKRKTIEAKYGKGHYEVLEIIERESENSHHVHEILRLKAPNGEFEDDKRFFYKYSNHTAI